MVTALLDWLSLPWSGSAQHHIEPWAFWHARCMVLGWAVLLPLGALAARYYKVTARQRWPEQLDNKAWWHSHQLLQWAGVLAMSAGVAFAWRRGHGAAAAAQLHALAGWALVALGWTQVAYGLARGSKGGPTDVRTRGDHYDMTPRRVHFERIHKSLGWLAVLAAIAVTVLGLQVADAPRWMFALLSTWWLLLATVAWRLQRRGRCVDTYQAIWGPDPRHPGNRIKPIGWGIRRPQA